QYPDIFHPKVPAVVQLSIEVAQSRIDLLGRYMHLGDEERILDVGAGNAVFGKVLKGVAPGATYDAVEPDSGSRQEWGPWVSNAYADLNEVKQAAYSGVVLNEVLEHVNQPVPFLGKIHRCLESRGYLFIDVPNRDDRYKPTVEPHILFWERRSLERAIGDAGFEILFCDSFGLTRDKAELFFWGASFLQGMGSRLFWLTLKKRMLSRLFWITLRTHLKEIGSRLFWLTLKKRMLSRLVWVTFVNRLRRKLGIKRRVDFTEWLGLDRYGGDRQWLRCIGRKI
ncbi:MAG: class I SAM-dependent methyltransferase, partial [Deltaproteobacteria bacterium]|nr:class I SAM-dependent methyltransferase [Deltaproteobacteria bacterium]